MASLAASIPVFCAIYFFGYWLRFEGQLEGFEYRLFAHTVGYAVGLKVGLFAWFRIYQSWSKYVTFHDLVELGKATTVASLLLVIVDGLFLPQIAIPRSIFLLDWGGTIVGVGGLASLLRIVRYEGLFTLLPNSRTPVLIVGANESGEALLRVLRRSRHLNFHVLGFVASDQETVGTQISGVPVLGSLEDTYQLVKRYRILEILIIAGELPGKTVRDLVEAGRELSVTVNVLPSYEQLIHGRMDIRPRTVSIEDLLRRDPVHLNLQEVYHWVDDKVILVTGSAGSIGAEICRQLLQFAPRKLVLVDRSENGQFYLEQELRQIASAHRLEYCVADINDIPRMADIFRTYQPDIVFHAAAYKHVPLMEANVGEAVKNITVATRQLADLANRFQVGSFVLISTDKAVNPTSVMGTCKRVAELYLQSIADNSACRFVIVRFGNVLDSTGSVVPIFREQIARGGPITVTQAEMTRYFMTIPEASQLVVQAGAMGYGGEIFVLDMGDPVRIVDLASDMIRLSGLRLGEDIEIKFTGRRPGEKLYEELYSAREDHLPTSHPKIRMAEADGRDTAEISAALDRLARRANAPASILRAELQAIVPEFAGDAIHDDSKPSRAA